MSWIAKLHFDWDKSLQNFWPWCVDLLIGLFPFLIFPWFFLFPGKYFLMAALDFPLSSSSFAQKRQINTPRFRDKNTSFLIFCLHNSLKNNQKRSLFYEWFNCRMKKEEILNIQHKFPDEFSNVTRYFSFPDKSWYFPVFYWSWIQCVWPLKMCLPFHILMPSSAVLQLDRFCIINMGSNKFNNQ